MKGLGTLVNVLGVLLGSSLGMLVGKRLPRRYRRVLLTALGLCTLLLGFKLALEGEPQVIVVILSVVLGAVIGELLKIEETIDGLADWLKRRISSAGPHFATGFVTASVLFCVGPLTMWGAINEGVNGNRELLYMKSAMDTIASLTLASAFGLGVLFSAVSVLVVQGTLTLLGTHLAFLAEPIFLDHLNAVGGVLIVAIGINLLELKRIKVANLLPALFVAVPLAQAYAHFFG